MIISAQETASNGSSCETKNFIENEADWILSEYQRPDEQGFYCPKLFTDFSSPDMWNREKVSPAFDSIKVVYEVKNKDIEEEEPPSFIFSLGNKPRLLRMYVPERNPQLIGIETISLSSTTDETSRSDPYGTRDPIKENAQVELTVRSFVNQGNSVRYTSNIKYISGQSGYSVEDSFSQDVQVPVPNPEEAEVNFGFGTLKNNCIKPIKYEICN